MLSRRAVLAGLAGGLAVRAARAQGADLPVIRLGSLPFGTSTWEAAVIKARGLDTANGFRLDTVKLAGNDAARISFIGGQVDTIIGDLLWAARLSNDGQPIRFIPYSTSEGAVMVPEDSPIKGLKDLAGKRLGVAGGALDKNWLLLKAQARDAAGLDLERAAEIAYGAPPLITLKLEQGALDAALTYWTYCARLQPKGFRRLIGAEDIMRALGATGDVALIGYLFRAETVAEKPLAVAGFARASRAAKEMLATDPSAWAEVRPLMAAEDEATFEALKREFLAGIPRRPIAAERADAEKLYAVMARLGGERLVGPGGSLPKDLYYDGARNG
ncbi:ABC transporter substrate-binding protein [Methylobacterium sp. NEAU 140]|uniref:ABC transporter substrate-binding protein n=1 Tax=Methylobacterium sp. NEAU 140 TaxID=3064945 RepID=UPI002736F39B|nr:ABC transporter substrate-binding protein [Methylobacterium sp. NEAU 140]MDP4025900.1 ABC transporter substrate-binding protein [Methylobacterium sp. NEAU 140]